MRFAGVVLILTGVCGLSCSSSGSPTAPKGANNVYPFRAEYDFIRFYRWNMDADYPCDDMSAACLKDIDVDLTYNNACDGVPLIGDVASCGQCGTTVRMACSDACQ